MQWMCKRAKIIISGFLQLLELSCKSWFIKVTSKFQKNCCFSQIAKKFLDALILHSQQIFENG